MIHWTDAEAVLDLLSRKVQSLVEDRSPDSMSPREKAGLIILTRLIIHQAPDDWLGAAKGTALINALGWAEWPKQPIQKSTTELLYRAGN
jgi:hypothetical protein